MTDFDPEALLDVAHERAAARLRALSDAHDAIVESSQSANIDDEHDPEGATVGFERAQLSALLDAAGARLAALDAAKDRLDRDRYGMCEACGAPIAHARLEAQPAAQTCVACTTRPQPRARR